MIEINNLTKVYDDTRVVDNLNLHVVKGELFGFLGPNGAGKTTTIRVLTTLTKATSGTIRINGYDVNTEAQQVKSSFGVVQQHSSLDKDLTIKENLDLHLRLRRFSKKDREKLIEEALQYTGLKDKANTLIDKLSGGMKRRVVIARALMHRPKVLFLDEPTVGLDAQTRRDLWELIRRLKFEGTTVFLTTHYIDEAEALCQRVGVMHLGKLIALGSPRELRAQLGMYTVETMSGSSSSKYCYFPDQATAKSYVSNLPPGEEMIVIRESNLEDVFIELTGQKVDGV
jgi:ABC-2 type transport system ATP-binding protein